jgi:NAD(P)-dependent dehydrogenase (short-subunit alcohol dehydrogenase family)
MGRLDIVISNHGWTRLTNFLDFSEGTLESDWDKCFTYNVKSHLWLMEAAKSHLDESEGAFVSTASLAGVKPSGSSLPYSVTKAAQIHLVKGLAKICGPRIRVNCISPGLLLTEWGMQFSEEARNKATEATILKRVPSVEVSISCYLDWLK